MLTNPIADFTLQLGCQLINRLLTIAEGEVSCKSYSAEDLQDKGNYKDKAQRYSRHLRIMIDFTF